MEPVGGQAIWDCWMHDATHPEQTSLAYRGTAGNPASTWLFPINQSKSSSQRRALGAVHDGFEGLGDGTNRARKALGVMVCFQARQEKAELPNEQVLP